MYLQNDRVQLKIRLSIFLPPNRAGMAGGLRMR
jgi:hypothetical protein